jgi:predicted enzyme related to lactoylglutathione lyase
MYNNMSVKNVLAWFDVPTLDFDRAVKFYSDILGEPVQVSEHMGQKLGFFPMERDGDVGGDILPPSDNFRPSAQGTRVYLSCDGQLDGVIGRVESAGGKIVRPKMSIGEPGWIALIEDTEGNVVGLHSKTE